VTGQPTWDSVIAGAVEAAQECTRRAVDTSDFAVAATTWVGVAAMIRERDNDLYHREADQWHAEHERRHLEPEEPVAGVCWHGTLVVGLTRRPTEHRWRHPASGTTCDDPQPKPVTGNTRIRIDPEPSATKEKQ
jgi:hypothetical protein